MQTPLARVVGESAALSLGAISTGTEEPRPLVMAILQSEDFKALREYCRADSARALGGPLMPPQEAITKDFEKIGGRSPMEIRFARDCAVWTRRTVRASTIEQHKKAVELAKSAPDLGFSQAEWAELRAATNSDSKLPAVAFARAITAKLGSAAIARGQERIMRGRAAEREIARLEQLQAADLTSDEMETLSDNERAAAIAKFAALVQQAERAQAEIEAARTTAGNAEAALRRVQEQMAKS